MTDSLSIQRPRFDVATAVTISLVVQTAISLLAACIPVLASEIAAGRNWSVTLVAFYPSIVFAAAFLISFEVPNLLKRMGGMGLSLACVMSCALGLVCLLSPIAAGVALAPLAIGCATGCMNPASAQVLGPRTSARTAGLIMSIKQTGVPLGGALAGGLVPWLVLTSGWRFAVVEMVLASVAMVVLFLPAVQWLNGNAKPAAARYKPLDPAKRLLKVPGMGLLLLASFAFSATQLCLRSFFTVYLVENQARTLAIAGLAFSASQLAGIVGQVGWAALSDRVLSARSVMAIIGMTMTAAALLTAVMTPAWPTVLIIVVAVLFGGSAAAFIPVVLGEIARNAPPDQVGVLTSGGQLFLMGGALAGPLAFGAIASLFGFPAAFAVIALCTFVGAMLLAPNWRIERDGGQA